MRRLVRIIRGLWLGVPPLTPIMLEGRIKRSQTEHERDRQEPVERDAPMAPRPRSTDTSTMPASN